MSRAVANQLYALAFTILIIGLGMMGAFVRAESDRSGSWSPASPSFFS